MRVTRLNDADHRPERTTTEPRRRAWKNSVVAASLTALASCATAPAAPATAAPAPFGGFCGDPELSGSPRLKPPLRRSRADLNGDGADELLLASEERCGPNDNCPWVAFRRAPGGCWTPIGEFSGLYTLGEPGPEGWREVKSVWRVTAFEMLYLTYRWSGDRYTETQRESCREQSSGESLCGPARWTK
jgi:hypothetical protein